MPKKKTKFDFHPDWSIVDEEGEQIKKGVATKTSKSSEEFVKVYNNAIDAMMKLDHRTFQVLMVCLRTCTFAGEHNEGSVVTNNKLFKDTCRKAIGKDKNGNELSDNAVNNYMSRLAKMNILVKYKCKGMFTLNPSLFVKGSTPQEVIAKPPRHIPPNTDFDTHSITPR